MAQHIRYITRRENGVYYYQRRVPKTVIDATETFAMHFASRPLFRKSLGTRRQADALSLGAGVHRWFEEKLRLVGGEDVSPTMPPGATRPLTEDRLIKISADARQRTIKPWLTQVRAAEQGSQYYGEILRMAEQRELDAPELRAILREFVVSSDPRMPNVGELARSVVEDERIDAPEGSEARYLIATAIRSGLIAGQEDIDEILAGKMPSAVLAPPSKASTVPTISDVVEDYCRHKTANRTIREARGALKSFVEIVGDLPLDEIARADFLRFCEAEGGRTIGGKSRGSVERPVSPDTLQKKVRLLHSAIERAIKRDRFAGPNPAAKIDAAQFTSPVPKAKMPDKRPFDVHEINLILQYPWFTGCRDSERTHEAGSHRLCGMHFWVPILALYTGCRAGELGGLLVNEVRLDHQYPHLVVRDNAYRTTKGSYRRNVPLLDALIALGFGDYVEAVAAKGYERLFPDWEAPKVRSDAGAPAWSNGSLIRSFNRTVVRTALRSIIDPAARQEVTFHSFRGAFKTLLGRAEFALPQNYIHEVVGHAKSNLDKRYVGEIPIEDTYPAVRRCDYQGITLPSAP